MMSHFRRTMHSDLRFLEAAAAAVGVQTLA